MKLLQLLGEIVLVIQKFILMSKIDGFWHGIKTDILRITYSTFNILIPKSVLVFFTFTVTSFVDTDLIIAWPQSLVCRLTLWFGASVNLFTYVNHFGAIMVYELRTLRIPETFHFRFPRCLADTSCMLWRGQNCRTTSNVRSSNLKKKDICKYLELNYYCQIYLLCFPLAPTMNFLTLHC